MAFVAAVPVTSNQFVPSPVAIVWLRLQPPGVTARPVSVNRSPPGVAAKTMFVGAEDTGRALTELAALPTILNADTTRNNTPPLLNPVFVGSSVRFVATSVYGPPFRSRAFHVVTGSRQRRQSNSMACASPAVAARPVGVAGTPVVLASATISELLRA